MKAIEITATVKVGTCGTCSKDINKHDYAHVINGEMFCVRCYERKTIDTLRAMIDESVIGEDCECCGTLLTKFKSPIVSNGKSYCYSCMNRTIAGKGMKRV